MKCVSRKVQVFGFGVFVFFLTILNVCNKEMLDVLLIELSNFQNFFFFYIFTFFVFTLFYMNYFCLLYFFCVIISRNYRKTSYMNVHTIRPSEVVFFKVH